MTPKQTIKLVAHECSEQLAAFSVWLERNERRIGATEPVLRRSFQAYANEIDTIQLEAERPAGIGVVGIGGSGQSWLVDALMGTIGDAKPDARHTPPQATLRSLQGNVGCDGNSAILRFSAVEKLGEMQEPLYGINLLGLCDLVVILVRVFHSECPGAGTLPLSHERIAATYEKVGRNLTSATLLGIKDRDLQVLRDRLAALFPDSVRLRMLTASGYWEDLAEVARHLPSPDRARVLSLLWGEQEDLTRIFIQLSQALARIWYRSDLLCPRSALMRMSAATGWLGRHPGSILDRATVSGLGDDRDEQIAIVSRNGTKEAIGAAALAALAAEITVPMATAPIAAAPAADLLVFPGLGPRRAVADEKPSSGNWKLERAQLLAAFSAAKASHLFARASEQRQITSLVVAVDPASDPTEAQANAITNWIDTHLGALPHLREQVEPGLFVVATRVHSSVETADSSAGQGMARWGGRLGGALLEAVGGANDWPAEWTPKRPFANVYLFQHPVGEVPLDGFGNGGARSVDRRVAAAQMLHALSSTAGLPRSYELDAEAVERDLASAEGGAAILARALGGTSQANDKYRHLKMQLAAIQRGLRARLLRAHVADEAAAITEWRRRVATLARHRLAEVAGRDGIGPLMAALMVGEHELRALFWQRRALAPTSQGYGNAPSAAMPAITLGEVVPHLGSVQRERVEQLASVAITYWFSAIRRSARSLHLCRAFGLSGTMLEHIVDEIMIGAQRLGLERHLADTCFKHLGRQAAPNFEHAFAFCAGFVINDFVERLALPAVAAQVRRPASLARQTDQPAAGLNGHAMPNRRLGAKAMGNGWCAALSRLIDDNIAAARPSTANSLDPELTGPLMPQAMQTIEVGL